MTAATLPTPNALVAMQRRDDSTLLMQLSGAWHLHHGMPSAEELGQHLAELRQPARVVVAAEVTSWDSSILTFLLRVADRCRQAGAALDLSALPEGLRRMMETAQAVPEKASAAASRKPPPFLQRLGLWGIEYGRNWNQSLNFLGQVSIAFWHWITARGRWRRIDLMLAIQDCGVHALGIVTLISYLVGIILAFMGAIQLQQFGAAIFVADLVGIAMVREMGAMMTAIIMAGRTGASFAAQLGSMKVSQEIDAFQTMGVSPVEFLVLPRMMGLILMMPLLCLYSDLVGILGGATIGTSLLHLSFTAYLKETEGAVTMTMLLGGLFKSVVYGVLVGLAGCLRGFECGTSSSAVGDAATRAVVMGIVLVVCACGLFAFVFNLLGI